MGLERASPVRWGLLGWRAGLDLLWGLATPFGALGQLLTAGLLVATAGTLGRPRVRDLGVVGTLAIVFAAWVGIAWLRAPGDRWAGVFAGHWLGPLVVAAATRRISAEQWIGPGVVAGLGVLGLDVAMAVAGHGTVVLHGWPRLVGPYGNLHTHAAVMAVLAPSAAVWAMTGRSPGRRGLGMLVAAGATLALGATFVRTAWLWAGITAVTALLAAQRWRAAVGVGLVGGIGTLVSGRFGTLLAALGGRPPAGGWDQLGSSRVEIWRHAVADAVASSPEVGWGGRGLGGHLDVYRHFDPHSEVLALGLQLGLVGLLIAVAFWGALGVALWRRLDPTNPWTALALGLWVGVSVTAPWSNDFVTRTTAAWWCWGLWGAVLGSEPPQTQHPESDADRERDGQVVVEATGEGFGEGAQGRPDERA